MDMGTVSGLTTLFAMLAFGAVAWWAYSRRPRERFRQAEQLPLEEDDSSEIPR
jgi:cytochrome c oxidase cbb3-type subunit 4